MGNDMDVGNRRKVVAIAIVGVIVIASVVGVWYATGQGRTYEGNFTDAMGRNITLDGVPDRIASCRPSTTETLFALGLGDKVVAVTQNCDYPRIVVDERKNGTLGNLTSYTKPSLEAILASEPDLVIMDAMVSGQLALLPQLEAVNVTVLMIYEPRTLQAIVNNINLLGKVFDVKDVADEYAEEITDRIAEVQERVADLQGSQTASFILSYSNINDMIATVSGGNTFVSDTIVMAGGSNSFSYVNDPTWPNVGIDTLASKNPSVIFLSSKMSDVNAQKLLNDMKTKELWKDIDAVKNDKVYILTDRASSIFTRPSVTIAEAVELMAIIFYPEEFGFEQGELPNILGNEYMDYLAQSE